MTSRPLTEKGRQALEKALHVPIVADEDGVIPFRLSVLRPLVASGYLTIDVVDDRAAWFITQAGRDVLSREIPRFLHARPHRNYTTNPALAARGEPEAVDDTSLDEFSRHAEQQRARSLHDQHLAVQELRLAERIARLEANAAALGLDIRRQLASVERMIAVAERRIRKDTAA